MADKNSISQSPAELFAEENREAEAQISAGDLAAGARILVDIIGRDPRNFGAYNNIGIISWMRKAWEDAYSMFMKSVSLKPDYGDALINLLGEFGLIDLLAGLVRDQKVIELGTARQAAGMRKVSC